MRTAFAADSGKKSGSCGKGSKITMGLIWFDKSKQSCLGASLLRMYNSVYIAAGGCRMKAWKHLYMLGEMAHLQYCHHSAPSHQAEALNTEDHRTNAFHTVR